MHHHTKFMILQGSENVTVSKQCQLLGLSKFIKHTSNVLLMLRFFFPFILSYQKFSQTSVSFIQIVVTRYKVYMLKNSMLYYLYTVYFTGKMQSYIKLSNKEYNKYVIISTIDYSLLDFCD